MNKDYIEGAFKDYAGNKRRFILACIWYDLRNRFTIQFGYAIQHPKDNTNTKLGKRIAFGRAYDNPFCITHIYSTQGDINTLAKTMLGIYAMHFKLNPGFIMPSYEERKQKYELSKKDLNSIKYGSPIVITSNSDDLTCFS